MKTKSPFSWNILLVSLACFLFTTHSSRGMFGEGYEERKKAEKAAAQQQAAQNARERELTASDNQHSDLQVDESSAPARGDSSSGGPSERTREEMEESETLRIIVRSYFPSLSQEEEDHFVNDISDKLLRSKILFAEANRICTPEDKIFFIASDIAEKAGVLPPATVADAVTAFQAASAKFIEINAELEEYESFLRSIGDPPLTKQQRADFTTQFTSNVAVKKKAAQQQTTQPSVKAAAVSLSAPVKAAATLPLPPPQESVFERQKNETLRNLREQIATAQRELPIHQATQERLQKEWATHEGRVRQTDLDLENFKAINPFTGSGLRFGFTEHSRQLLDQKDRLETACINAVRSRNQFVATTRDNLEAAKRSITTISSRIQSLEGEHARVAASEDPVIVEKRRQEEAAARAIALEQQHQRQQQEAAARALTREQRRQQEIAEGKIAGLAQRKAIEAQLAAERAKALAQQQRATALTATYHSPSEEAKRLSMSSRESAASSSPPSTPPGSKGDSSPEQLLAKRLSDHSNGSTSGEESNHSTPEKMKTPLMTEIERLEEQVNKIHETVGKIWKAIKESETSLNNSQPNLVKAFWSNWNRYLDLAEERSRLKQYLSILRGNHPEPPFKASDKKALLSQYRALYRFHNDKFVEYPNKDWLMDKLEDIYKSHGVPPIIDDYPRGPEVQELEHPLSKRLQEGRQEATMPALQAELALLAVEEHPPILQQIEECVWQNMPGFSDSDRRMAAREVRSQNVKSRNDYELALKYSGASSPAASSATSYAPNAYGLQYQQNSYQRLNQQQQGFNNWQAANQVSFGYNQMRISSNNYSYK